MFLVGILVLILGLIVSVALHELGHLVPAKKFGALVPEYWIGFGPVLFSKRIGGTVYGLKAILLGGYVRIVGMFPPAGVAVASSRPDRGMVADARLQSAEDIAAAKAEGSVGTPFYLLRTVQKLIIMMGGPLMNLLLALLLSVIVVTGLGWSAPSTTVAEVVPTTTELQVEGPSRPTPAAEAGIVPGDRIVFWNGTEVTQWDQLRTLMGQTPASGATVVVERDGTEQELLVTPLETEEGMKVGVVADLERVRGTPLEALQQTGRMFTGTVSALWHLPQSLWNLAAGMGTDAPRDPEGAVSVVGVARIAGEVASVGGNSVSFADRAAMLLSLLASLNMALFVFNLLPLPPLDGGHVVGALWGGAKNQVAKWRGKPKPAPVDTAKMVPLSYGVFLALVGISLLLMAADLIKPLEW